MCRFALIKSSIPIKPQQILEKFANMARNTPAFDGDWQGDGWGISYLDEQDVWQIHKSLKPIWEEQNIFSKFPASSMLVIHARSASFPQHKGKIEYNQPYINNQFAFVFNGLLKKVHFPYQIPGKIGAQKLFYLLNQTLSSSLSFRTLSLSKGEKSSVSASLDFSPSARNDEISILIHKTLIKFETLLKNNVDEIQACNIGLSDGANIYALNLYSKHPDYYKLYSLDTPDLKIICSGNLEGYDLTPFKSKTIVL